MRILITGLAGFTGRYMAIEARKHQAEVLDLAVDLLDLAAVNARILALKPDYVVHLAAISSVTHPEVNEIYQVNLLGTRNLLAALAEYAPQVKSILLASSANIYGNNPQLLSEAVLPKPLNDYAVSKLAMELMADLWLKQLPIFIVRPFNYIGVGQNQQFLVAKIVDAFQQRKPQIELGNLTVYREFNDVRMVAEIYYKLLLQRPTGQVLNICSGQCYSIQKILTYCQQLTGHCLEVCYNPIFSRSNEIQKLYGCNKRLRSVIGAWQHYSLEETLRWMLFN